MHPCIDGWCLSPNGEGTLTYWIEPPSTLPAGSTLALALWFYVPPLGTNHVEVSSEGGRRFETLSRNTTLIGRRLATKAHVNPGERVAIRFSAANGGTTEVLVLDQLMVMYDPPHVEEGARATFFSLSSRLGLFLVLFCVGAAALPLSHSPVYAVLALITLAYAGALRLHELRFVMQLALDPDAQGYRALADRMALFTSDNGFFSGDWGQREPLFILAVKLFFDVVGSSDYHLRLFSTLLSVVAVGAVMFAATRMFGPTSGIVCGILMAVNEPLQREAARGLRLELEMVLLVCYWILAFGWSRPGGLTHAALLGVWGGMLALLRMTYFPVVMVSSAAALWSARLSLRNRAGLVALASVLTVAAVVPHRVSLYRHTGDPFHDTALYARWNANMEFAGQRGYPTLEELQRDAYVGPKLTYFDYLFGLHTVGEVAVGTLRGLVKLFQNMNLFITGGDAANISLQVTACLGFLLSLRDRRFWWLAPSFLILASPVAFLYDRGLVERYRHTFAAYPLVLFAAVYLLRWLGTRTAPYVRHRTPAPSGRSASRCGASTVDVRLGQ